MDYELKSNISGKHHGDAPRQPSKEKKRKHLSFSKTTLATRRKKEKKKRKEKSAENKKNKYQFISPKQDSTLLHRLFKFVPLTVIILLSFMPKWYFRESCQQKCPPKYPGAGSCGKNSPVAPSITVFCYGPLYLITRQSKET